MVVEVLAVKLCGHSRQGNLISTTCNGTRADDAFGKVHATVKTNDRFEQPACTS